MRFSRVALPLRPMSGVAPLNADAGEWMALDEDPQFEIPVPRGWEGRWVRLEVEIEPATPWSSVPMLYIDTGAGYSESQAVSLPAPAAGTRTLDFVFPLPPKSVRARLDPMAQAGPFRLGTPRLQRLGKARAGLAMLTAVARARGWRRLADDAQRLLLPPSPARLRTFVLWLVDIYRAPPTPPVRDYATWIRFYEPNPISYRFLRESQQFWDRKPVISIVMQVSGSTQDFLANAIASVLHQEYGNWELLVTGVPVVLERERANVVLCGDPRVKVVEPDADNAGAYAAVNRALGAARGDFVLLLDDRDLLHPLALHYLAEEAVFNPDADIIFSDEDKVDGQGVRHDPHFKCEFNYELLLSHNAIARLCAFRRSLLEPLGGLRAGLEGAQEYDLLLRALESTEPGRVVHIPRVLYHLRTVGGAADGGRLDHPESPARITAVEEHLRRVNAAAEVTAAPGFPTANRVRYRLPGGTPLVSIIIPTRDRADLLKTCVESVLQKTTYGNYEILIVDNNSEEAATFELLKRLEEDARVTVLQDKAPFNFSRLNNLAASRSHGPYLCLMNNDIEVVTADWLEELLSFAARPGVGAVGGRLWYPDGRLQHAGVVLGIGGVAGHAHRFLGPSEPGYCDRAVVHQSFSAVTAALLLVRRSVYEQVGGLDEAFEVAFNDVDFCLRIREAGYRIVWTPYAEMIHYESASRGLETTPEKRARFQGEVERMYARWGTMLTADPAYSPNLTLEAEDFSLAWPPRLRWGSRSLYSYDRISSSGKASLFTDGRRFELQS